MRILETQWHQRKYDEKWEKIGKIVDEDELEILWEMGWRTDRGNLYVLPEKWITLGVYDYIMEIEE